MSQLSKPSLQPAPSFLSQPASQPASQTDRQMPSPGGIFDGTILHLEAVVTDSRIRQTIHLIRTNLHLPISLETIARQVNLSASRLRTLFCEVIGIPLAQFIKLLRLETARHLLMTEFLTVKEVMVKTGIKDPSHFNRDFKLIYGVTPAQYRNRSKVTDDQVSLDSHQGNSRQAL